MKGLCDEIGMEGDWGEGKNWKRLQELREDKVKKGDMGHGSTTCIHSYQIYFDWYHQRVLSRLVYSIQYDLQCLKQAYSLFHQ